MGVRGRGVAQTLGENIFAQLPYIKVLIKFLAGFYNVYDMDLLIFPDEQL